MMKQLFKQAQYGEKGSTLSELLVNVVAVFSILTAVAIPYVSNIIGQDKTESYDMDNTTTDVTEILTDRAADTLDGAATDDT